MAVGFFILASLALFGIVSAEGGVACIVDDFEAGTSKLFAGGCGERTDTFAIKNYEWFDVFAPPTPASTKYMTNLDACSRYGPVHVTEGDRFEAEVFAFAASNELYPCTLIMTDVNDGSHVGGAMLHFTNEYVWRTFSVVAEKSADVELEFMCTSHGKSAIFAIDSVSIVSSNRQACHVPPTDGIITDMAPVVVEEPCVVQEPEKCSITTTVTTVRSGNC